MKNHKDELKAAMEVALRDMRKESKNTGKRLIRKANKKTFSYGYDY